MSDILCRWLNQELQLSKSVEPMTITKDFSSGYLFGEVLHKYQMQDDFRMFMRRDTSVAKLNNFTRLEPTFKLLGISFTTNTAQDVMREKQGVATCLLYELHVSLEKKKKEGISRTMMEITQPAASANLLKKEHIIFSDRLHKVVKRDADLKLPNISQRYAKKYQHLNGRSVVTHPMLQKRQKKDQGEKRIQDIKKPSACRQMHNDMTNQVHVPNPPPYTSRLNLKERHQQQQQQQQQQQHKEREEQVMQTVQTEIDQFEANRKKLTSSGFASASSDQPLLDSFPLGSINQGGEVSESGTKVTLQSNSKYIQGIRQRLQDSAESRERREKRVNRFLVEQLKAQEAREEARWEEQLVKRLTRQTQQEKRLAVQLLLIRKEKEVIRQNRLFREQQYQQRREKDFQEALHRESILAQQVKLDCEERIRQELGHCNRIASERTQIQQKEHLKSCRGILEQIVDLATKVGEYRLLTGNLIPEKMTREWKELLLCGLPLYEPIKGHQPEFDLATPLDPVELKKQEILDTQDYDEYSNVVGEWAWPEEAEGTKLLPTNNDTLGHVVQRLRNIVHPPCSEPSPPLLPHFAIKACVLGKICSGKTSCLAKIAEAHGFCVLSADALIEEALHAYKVGEKVSQIQCTSVLYGSYFLSNPIFLLLFFFLFIKSLLNDARYFTVQNKFFGGVQNVQVPEQLGGKENEQLVTSSASLKSDYDTQEENKDSNATLSTRAVQGEAADKEMRNGNPIPNELLVDIIVEAISRVPAQSGWILDGFPLDITHAFLLEKALGGSVDLGEEVVNSKTNLVVDPNPPKPTPPPAPVLDLALLLDIPDECVVRRALSHIDSSAASQPTDKTLYWAQIPHRITAFQDAWPELERWFGAKQNILVRVDADVDDGELYRRVESAMQQALASPFEDVVIDSGKTPELSTSPPPADQLPALGDEDPGLTECHSSPKEENTHSSGENSTNVSPASLTNEDSLGGGKNPPESASSSPDSPSCIYVDEPLPPEIPEFLCSHWDTVCDSYVSNVKTVMQQLRSQRTLIFQYLFNIREGYKHYLGRPDLKQEFVSRWQKDFNSIPDDMREDEDTKAELHLRLDELREHLCDITEERKVEDEQERTALMSNGWLEDNTSVLVNHHSTLMQVEMARFWETLCFLKLYYLNMHSQTPPQLPSKFVSIPLLGAPGSTDHQDSRRPASSRRASKTGDLDGKEPPPYEKLISDYEETLTTISKLVLTEVRQCEAKEKKEAVEENEKNEKKKAPSSAAKTKKEKPSSKKQKGPPSPDPVPSPAPVEDKNLEKICEQQIMKRIHEEYIAALKHEESRAKEQIALVKCHGVAMLQSLQSRAEQTFSSMEECSQERHLAEMRSIDQLQVVLQIVCHHIQRGTKLQNQLVLEGTDFYINGDCLMEAIPPPPPRAPSLEKPKGSTPTITQLESLRHQLFHIAPSGLMCSFEFSSVLKNITSVKTGRDTLPEAWMASSDTQLMEIVSLFVDECDLIDWRRFLLSAALPWPFPSITQLLDVLQGFKAADTGAKGYINEEQYLQTELWFSSESILAVPEDPSEPAPYDRLANLRKFFFQLFADHRSFATPQLDYVSMLQYFAADPNPKQGFIRALSVQQGQHLKLTSLEHLVKSMPSIEEDPELSSLEQDGNSKEHEQEVSIPAILAVICHKIPKMKDKCPLRPACLSLEEHTEHLEQIFRELGYKPEDCIPFSILSEHPFIQGLMETSTHYQLVNVHRLLLVDQDEDEESL
ncbi:sperm flagellar protein 2 [Mugil cephalus]|uniref:sperm flagellar protein 2 n=1 Tax=Mugil cephalus TaxID=48193 RepID=UPI001FB60ACE|nr:sperm flagellar protein 2 [Mugil cephalus]